jgi:CubicO group peptidase (beta-lactamase class C family)
MRPVIFKKYMLLCCGLSIGISLFTRADGQSISSTQLDSMANKAMKTFNVPGMSVAIVKDGKVIYLRGYGIRSIITRQKTDENTLFGIASNSKAFTSAALGILVDEGKLKWDDKVIKYLPDFKMYDDYATANFTIRDLLTHRSGLGLGAGDLMHNPDSTNFTIKDIIYNLRFLKPARSFRSGYAYDNILYLVAGEIIARVSGMSWADFIEKHIMNPLQMNNSRASYGRIKGNANVITGHSVVNGKLKTLLQTDAGNDVGAGGIYSSAADMSKWMLMQLNDGKYGEGLNRQLLSSAVHKEMWTPQIVIPVVKRGMYNTHFGAYGLGWFLIDLKGYLQVSHTGQDDGMISEVAFIPELNFGITVLTNQEGGGAVRAVVDQVTDSYVGITGTDRIREYEDRINHNAQAADTVTKKVWEQVAISQNNGNENFDPALYTGTYHDNWFGDVVIEMKDGKLWFRSKRSLQLKGYLAFYQNNTFVIKWVNEQIKADAFVFFTLNAKGQVIGMTMKPISPKTSLSFDFQDLDFHKSN